MQVTAQGVSQDNELPRSPSQHGENKSCFPAAPTPGLLLAVVAGVAAIVLYSMCKFIV